MKFPPKISRLLRLCRTKGKAIQLEKWYLDLTTPEGEVFIGYWARVRAWRMSMNWSRWSLSGPAREPESGASLSADDPPVESRSLLRETERKTIAWNHAALGIEGEWRSRSPSHSAVLLEQQDGSVHWHCRCPAGDARLRVGERSLEGVGYVESLSISLPPWSVPIQELHWGRFIADDASLVWIRWGGPRPLTLALLNGCPVPASQIDRDGVATQDLTLQLQEVRGLPEAHLGAALGSSLRAFRRVVPNRFFPANEQKWLSRGLLHIHSRQPLDPTPGWAIHERVRFEHGAGR